MGDKLSIYVPETMEENQVRVPGRNNSGKE
jgi:hypothetical protein